MGSAVQSSPLTSTLTMRAFLTVFLAVSVCGEADPYTIGQVLAGATNGGVITGVSYGHGLGAVAGFPYTAVHHPVYAGVHYIGKREAEAEAEPEPYTIGQVLAGQTAGGVITSTTYGHGLKVAGFPYTAVAAPVVAPLAHHGVVGYSGLPLVYGKREAEAEPFYGYGVVPYLHHGGIVANTGLGHAVAVTGYGHVTHSSNVGVCTNDAGVQVPC